MTRMQVQLTEDQVEKLKRRAQQKECSVSALVRQAVDSLLAEEDEEYAEKWRRATAVIGCFSSGLTDVAERHDDYLDEAYGS